MFEPPQSKEKSSGTGMWIGIVVVIVLVVGGAWAYLNSKDAGKAAEPAAAAVPVGNADPVHDLRVITSKMAKDPSGTTAVWTIEVKNQSPGYTYSNIAYETTYAGADNATLALNHGTIPSYSLGPGESQETVFRDTGYPNGTAWFKFRITGATATK